MLYYIRLFVSLVISVSVFLCLVYAETRAEGVIEDVDLSNGRAYLNGGSDIGAVIELGGVQLVYQDADPEALTLVGVYRSDSGSDSGRILRRTSVTVDADISDFNTPDMMAAGAFPLYLSSLPISSVEFESLTGRLVNRAEYELTLTVDAGMDVHVELEALLNVYEGRYGAGRALASGDILRAADFDPLVDFISGERILATIIAGPHSDLYALDSTDALVAHKADADAKWISLAQSEAHDIFTSPAHFDETIADFGIAPEAFEDPSKHHSRYAVVYHDAAGVLLEHIGSAPFRLAGDVSVPSLGQARGGRAKNAGRSGHARSHSGEEADATIFFDDDVERSDTPASAQVCEQPQHTIKTHLGDIFEKDTRDDVIGWRVKKKRFKKKLWV